MDKFIGSLVSLNCGESLGVYQGRVEAINTYNNTLTISNTFKNGLPYKLSQVTLRSQDITELEIISEQEKVPLGTNHLASIQQQTPTTSPKRAHLHSSATTPSNKKYTKSSTSEHYQGVLPPNMHHFLPPNTYASFADSSGDPHRNHRKGKVIASFSEHDDRHFKALKQRDTECFQRCEGDFEEEFDFEMNLSLFQKLPNNQSSDSREARLKYKCHENVIKACQVSFRQVFFFSHPPGSISSFPVPLSLPNPPTLSHLNPPSSTCIFGEYITDAGFLLPGVSEAVRDHLIALATSGGFSLLRVVESYGRDIAEAVMQYLGGSARFEAKNAHQKPLIVVLLSTSCLPWVSAAALNSARHLANRAADVRVYLMPSQPLSALLSDELALFALTTTGRVVPHFKDLPLERGLDIVISTLNSPPQSNNHSPASKNINNDELSTETILNRISKLTSPIFAVEPSSHSTFPTYKRSFVCALPLWLPHSSFGQVCYCDLGFPADLYAKAGISYRSPFFHRFFLPLHCYQNRRGGDQSVTISSAISDERP